MPPRADTRKPQILAPQASDWETNLEEIEVVKGRRTGLILLFLFALLAVAVIALGLAALSVLRGGDDTVAGEEEAASTTTTTAVETTLDPNRLDVVITEEPFICDGATRQFGELSGAAPNEEVAFSSPQSSGLSSGTADASGRLPIRWQCAPEQAGTTWELTATGVTSGKSVTFLVAGATASSSAAGSTELTVELVENPFRCDGESRVFGGLAGAEPGEEIAFSSPQATGLSPGTADDNGELDIRWQCVPDRVGTTWELTATGVTSGRSVTFTFTGS